MSQIKLAVYYEGGTLDRFWVAPAGLDLGEAKKQKLSLLYRTRDGAMASLAGIQRALESKA